MIFYVSYIECFRCHKISSEKNAVGVFFIRCCSVLQIFKIVIRICAILLVIGLSILLRSIFYKPKSVIERPFSINFFIVWPDEPANHTILPDLNSMPWPKYQRPNLANNSMVAYQGPFDLKMSNGQYATLLLLIEKFQEIMISLKLQNQWFMGAGTLLGSLQHHDIIPWDDDADLFLHVRYRQQVQNALRKLNPKFGTYWQRTRDKLFFKSFQKGTKTDADSIGSHNLSRYPWAWPFLDIAYYHELNTDRGIEFGVNHRRFNLRDIYPLTYRPFGKHWFPAPRRPISFLGSYYSTKRQRCSSPAYSHALEKSIKSYEKDCRKLMSQYAFVQRCPLRDSRRSGNSTVFCDEYLVDGNAQIIHKIRTVLDPDEIGSKLFTARHGTFKCPS